MHRSGNISALKTAILSDIKQRIEPLFQEEGPHPYNVELVRLLDTATQEIIEGSMDNNEGPLQEELSEKKQARQTLLKHCPRPWFDDTIWFYCPYELRITTKAGMAMKLMELLENAYLKLRPPIPVVNRWNKVFGPFTWWHFGCCFYKLVPRAVLVIAKGSSNDEINDVVDMAADMIGLMTAGGTYTGVCANVGLAEPGRSSAPPLRSGRRTNPMIWPPLPRR